MSTTEHHAATPDEIRAAIDIVQQAQQDERDMHTQLDSACEVSVAPYVAQIKEARAAIRREKDSTDQAKTQVREATRAVESQLVTITGGLITVTPEEDYRQRSSGLPRGFLIPELRALFEFGSDRNLDLIQFLSFSEGVRRRLLELKKYHYYDFTQRAMVANEGNSFPFVRRIDLNVAPQLGREMAQNVNHKFSEAMYDLVSAGASDFSPLGNLAEYAGGFATTQASLTQMAAAFSDRTVYNTRRGFLDLMQDEKGLEIYFEISHFSFTPKPWSPP